jgi:DNA-binding MarR family transcriptional regulator
VWWGVLVLSLVLVWGVLFRLVRGGGVVRRPDEKDKRANRLYLTGAGKRKIDTVLPRHDELVAGIMRGMTTEQVRGLRDLLAMIDKGVGGE